jgi:hypothetical protein
VSANLAERGLKDPRVLGARRSHGSRLRYLSGCKCLKCRMANSNYEALRARARKNGDWNGLIDTIRVREHLFALSRAGVGYKSVADAADVGRTCLMLVRQGKRHHIRARAAKRVLAVTSAAIADGALVRAERTWRLIKQLLAEGFTQTRIARELGSQARAPALQLRRDFVLASSALKVEKLWRKYMQ